VSKRTEREAVAFMMRPPTGFQDVVKPRPKLLILIILLSFAMMGLGLILTL